MCVCERETEKGRRKVKRGRSHLTSYSLGTRTVSRIVIHWIFLRSWALSDKWLSLCDCFTRCRNLLNLLRCGRVLLLSEILLLPNFLVLLDLATTRVSVTRSLSLSLSLSLLVTLTKAKFSYDFLGIVLVTWLLQLSLFELSSISLSVESLTDVTLVLHNETGSNES